MKSGVISIMGRPNTGKSTLLNQILETKLAITSHVSGTTRNNIRGIYEDDEAQLIFIDTPGIHKPKSKLDTILNKRAYTSSHGVDLVLFLMDATKPFNKGDEFILNHLKKEDIDVFLILNKVDKVNKDELLKLIDEYQNIFSFKEIIPISALKNDNIDDLIDTIKKYMPHDGKLLDSSDFTNITTDFYISEIIREKILLKTKEEVPHSVAVLVEERHETKDKVKIGAVIVVNKKSIKKIIIGKNGSMLKDIGTLARVELEEYFGRKVYLSLFVKVIESWKEEDTYLKEFNLFEVDE